MYCPVCGFENPEDALFCESCGESLERETKYEKHKKKLHYASILSFTMIFGGIFIKIWQISAIGAIAFLSCFIVYPLLPRLSGGSHVKRYCPRCELSEFNENFCVQCGYNLDDVLGYYKTDKYDIEMNKNFIKIYEKTRYQEASVPDREGWHSHHRAEPKTFTLDKISNLRLTECKHTFSHRPCLVFEYDDEKCRFYLSSKEEGKCMVKADINSQIQRELGEVLSRGIYDMIMYKEG